MDCFKNEVMYEFRMNLYINIICVKNTTIIDPKNKHDYSLRSENRVRLIYLYSQYKSNELIIASELLRTLRVLKPFNSSTLHIRLVKYSYLNTGITSIK